MITVSAPGKIHLLGEHAVVYGKPAILAAIDKRIYVRIKNKNELFINSDYGNKLIKDAISVFQKAFSIDKLPPFKIEVNSQLPIGSGLGSSAALSAATIGALMKFVKNIWNPVRINELAYEVEKIAHGNPSGADNTAVVFGGLVWFRREFDFLKSIWSLPISSYKIPQFILIDSGKPEETTKEMVDGVARLYKRNKKKMEEVFNDQERQTKNLLLALREGDRKQLINAIQGGQRNLEEMGVVSDFAKKIAKEVEKKGGAAKVCGGGGRKKRSGILLCYHENLMVLKRIGEKYDLSIHDVKLGGEGIRIENYG
jgi:mevalonate kinase